MFFIKVLKNMFLMFLMFFLTFFCFCFFFNFYVLNFFIVFFCIFNVVFSSSSSVLFQALGPYTHKTHKNIRQNTHKKHTNRANTGKTQ